MIICPICKSSIDNKNAFNFSGGKDGALFYICLLCKFIFRDRNFMISEAAEKLRYLQHQNTIKEKGYVDFLENFINIAVLDYEREVYRILDFGCGPFPVLVELLNRKGFVTDYYDKYFYPEYPAETIYDMITATEVLEHISDPISIFMQLRQRLSDGGYLSLMTEFYPVDRKEIENWYYLRDKTHISFYCEETIEYIGSVTGYQVIKIGGRRISVFKKINS